ncbi:SAM-dependent methyltransferase [Methylosinus sp. Sm6]|uniref:class I SAM-dependent methyltransferase n=1 Tax=Methylosinus sp. Sm6 TaxID=2866948 RepID=UPI001C99096D|nr:SAM-dependent methyltransferase [Methylosinus sp. Sm6]MBY6243529.1 class I SAM-dependent methyltransferase [Methylosinus sp. Sm6]
MQNGQPSRTALGAAIQRAAHQTLDSANIFEDAFARVLLGREADALIEAASADPAQRQMRTFMAARSRFAEDCLNAAVSRGVRQLAILGAGLDTFSLRNPHATQGLRVFEVDHPATQAWKRGRIAEAGLTPPASLTFAPVDFERQSLAEALGAAGFQPTQPAFFHWLGVVPYLPRDAISAILRFVASVPRTEVVFDYSEPLENYPPERRGHVAAVAARAAALGEPWLSYFDPSELSRDLHERGFQQQEDLGLADIAVRYLGAPKRDATGEAGPHVIHARRID